jgi:hypothetical protein
VNDLAERTTTTTRTHATPTHSTAPTHSAAPARAAGAARRRKAADDKAIASFVLGLVGLAVFNLVLGPLALALSGTALAKGTGRRGRALLGAALGAADLVIIGVIMATHPGVSWHPGL